jgi:hypothetical protein
MGRLRLARAFPVIEGSQLVVVCIKDGMVIIVN